MRSLVFRGDRASREFIAFWVADGRVVAGMNVNVWEVNGSVQNLIRSRVRVDVSALRDESRSLDSLLGPAGAQTPGVGS
ncbi:oxidoreductase C-terminal domain-containing protein [Cryobacterium breve]|uniref:oxidoreductase C-terminal domain-containing protein n=1 Tax=Cryobacterium breve TaxID=1259258 RepID=UPI0032B18445